METLVQFTESGNVTIDSSMTSVRVSPLTPGTSYQFRLSAITSEGPGEEIRISDETNSPQDDSGKYTCLLQEFWLHVLGIVSGFSRFSLLRKRPHIPACMTVPHRFCKRGGGSR